MGGLAYSLSRSETGWSWSVFDAQGVTLASGLEASRTLALEALDLTLRAAAQAAVGRGAAAPGLA